MNMWDQLTRPVIDRPGTPQEERHKRARRPVGTCAPVPRRKRVVAPEDAAPGMPRELIERAHMEVASNLGLTRRQMQILDMLVQGMTSTEVAAALQLSLSAVSTHTCRIRATLGVQTLPQAVVRWHQHFRVAQGCAQLVSKDDALIANLARATEEIVERKAAERRLAQGRWSAA